MSSAYAKPLIRKANISETSEKVSKAENPPFNDGLISLESTDLIKITLYHFMVAPS